MAGIVWSGLEELKAALRALPADLTGEASHIVEGAANGAAVAIRSAYPVRTGDLRESVEVIAFTRSQFSTGAQVVSTSKYATIFENGSQARHNAIGANRGSMPPGHVFVPRMIRARRLMYEQLADLLRRKGLLVSGHA